MSSAEERETPRTVIKIDRSKILDGNTSPGKDASKAILDLFESQSKTKELFQNVGLGHAEKLAQSLSGPSEQLKNTLTSIAATNAINKSTAKMAQDFAKSFEKTTSPWVSMGASNSLTKAAEIARKSSLGLEKLTQSASVQPVHREFDTSWMLEHTKSVAEDKARERDAHEAMIEMREIQITTNQAFDRMAETQEVQAQFTKALLEVQKDLREDQKESGEENRRANRKILLLTFLAVVIGSIGTGVTVAQYLESKHEKRNEVVLKKIDQLQNRIFTSNKRPSKSLKSKKVKNSTKKQAAAKK